MARCFRASASADIKPGLAPRKLERVGWSPSLRSNLSGSESSYNPGVGDLGTRVLVGRLGIAALIALAPGCGPSVAVEAEQEPAVTSSAGGTTSTTGSTTLASTTSTEDSGQGEGSARLETSTGAQLDLPEPSQGECSTWTQDCPDGLRCVLRPSAAGAHTFETECHTLAPDPAGAGEPCSLGIGGVAEADSCDIGMWCDFVDPDTGDGICTPFCVGSPEQAACDDPARECLQYDDTWNVCVYRCDAFLQDCPPTLACHLNGSEFMCVPDRSMGGGGYGEPCNGFGSCAPGNTCLSFRKFDDCDGICCSPWCDVDAPNTCPGPNQLCVPFNTGSRDPALANLGVCANEH